MNFYYSSDGSQYLVSMESEVILFYIDFYESKKKDLKLSLKCRFLAYHHCDACKGFCSKVPKSKTLG